MTRIDGSGKGRERGEEKRGKRWGGKAHLCLPKKTIVLILYDLNKYLGGRGREGW